MGRHNEGEYAFSCAVIRSNERTLLSGSDLQRVLDAKQFAGALAVMGEFGYGNSKETVEPAAFEKVLRAELDRVYKLVFSIVPDRQELELFLFQNDYHNIKVLLKSEFLKLDPAPLLVDTGRIDPEKLAVMIKERNFLFMPEELKVSIEEAIDTFGKNRDPQEIDIILDKACYKDMLAAAEETKNEFIIGYVRLLIDILNINTFIRLREIGRDWAFFRKVFLEGGQVEKSFFMNAFEKSYQQLADEMSSHGYSELFSVGAEAIAKTKKYTALEKLGDDMRTRYAKSSRFVTMGIEPVMSFLIAKEGEIKNLRVILAGKLSGTDTEIIRERLRETYV